MRTVWLGAALAAGLLAADAVATSAMAGPTYTFTTSTGIQPSNVGTITITQIDSTHVDIKLDLISSTYGILSNNLAFGFTLDSAAYTGNTLSITKADTVTSGWITPAGGVFSDGAFSLETGSLSQPSFGSYNVGLADSAKSGSSHGYYGDLEFVLQGTSAISTSDFIANASGVYFTADLSNGSNTGAQAWETRVPEPMTLSLFGAGLAGVAALRRRKAQKA